MTIWSDYSFSQWSGPERDHDPESRADEHQPREYVTESPSRPSMTDARRSTRRGLSEPEPGS